MHFDRVLPKTDGYFHYDKFNQLRLSNDLSADREQDGQLALPEHIQHKQVRPPLDYLIPDASMLTIEP
jgi:hypothetical protein